MVVGTGGHKALRRVTIRPIAGNGSDTMIECDLLAVSGGWNPTLHLYAQAQGRTRFDEGLAAFVPDGEVAGVEVIGAARGSFALSQCLAEGAAAGARAATSCGFASGEISATADRAGRRDWTQPPVAAAAAARRPACLCRSAQRCDRRRYRARGARGLYRDRACQALHDLGHGHRPGQDRQCRRARAARSDDRARHRRDRADDLPPALCAGRVRSARRAGAGPARGAGARDADA